MQHVQLSLRQRTHRMCSAMEVNDTLGYGRCVLQAAAIASGISCSLRLSLRLTGGRSRAGGAVVTRCEVLLVARRSVQSPGSIRGNGRRHVDHKLAKISPIRLMGCLVRERKCSLVASAKLLQGSVWMSLFFGETSIFFFPPDAKNRNTYRSERDGRVDSRETKPREKRTKDDSGCMYIGWRLSCILADYACCVFLF